VTPGLPALLASYLASGHRIAGRLAVSIERVAPLFPLDAAAVERLSADDEERLDAFLYRFASLAASVQDHVGRALLLTEEESLASASRKDQRLLLERLGALDEGLRFGDVAELRNRLSHSYPNEPRKQAEVMSLVYARAADLIAAYNGMLDYATRRGIDTGLSKIVVGARPPSKPE
jgi:hypothetical protein